MKNELSKLSVIIPVYNSESSLEALLERLISVLQKITADFEVLLINEGSQDGS